MAIPTLPKHLFKRPFASQGNYTVIPDEAGSAGHGRASLMQGFPIETQQPLAEGGVAPSRPDFNGILYMLSSFAYWQQSGGLWTYDASLGYTPPAMVYHKETLWVVPYGQWRRFCGRQGRTR